MSGSAIGQQRLYYQRITHPTFTDAGAAAAWLGALQGQDYLGTKWAFGVRLPGSTEADIDRAIAERQIVRTWALRGTLHYVAAADLHWIVGLIAPRQIAGNAGRYKELGLDEPTLARTTVIIADALRDGQQLTRTELLQRIEAKGIATTGQRGLYMLQRVGLERLAAQGAMQGNETTFFALAPGATLPKEAALAELARRYFLSRGPATLADFAHWSGLSLTEARAGLASIQGQLAEARHEGQPVWQSPEAPQQPEQVVYLLPGFDEYILGYKDRSAILEPQFANAICPGGNGIFMPTIVSAGQVVGTWKRTLKRRAVEIALHPFRPLEAAETAGIAAAVDRYGAFLDLPAVIVPQPNT